MDLRILSPHANNLYHSDSVERAFASPIPLQLFQGLFQFLSSLTFESLRPKIRDIISLGVIFVTFVTRYRPSQGPSQPSSRTPAVPERGFDIVRRRIPLLEIVTAIFVGLFREGDIAKGVWSRWRQVAESQPAGGENRREDCAVECSRCLVAEGDVS